MTDTPHSRPHRFLVEEADGLWLASYEHQPEVAFTGQTTTDAFKRLTGRYEPQVPQESWRYCPPLL